MNRCGGSPNIDLLSWLLVVHFHVHSFSSESLKSLRAVGYTWPPNTTGLDADTTEKVNKIYIDVTEATRTETFDPALTRRVREVLSFVEEHFRKIREGNLP